MLYIMKKEILAVRDVDEEIYMKFRKAAITERIKMGEALTLAMKDWIKKENKIERKNPRNLLKINGIIQTNKKVKWSEEIDEFLYGLK